MSVNIRMFTSRYVESGLYAALLDMNDITLSHNLSLPIFLLPFDVHHQLETKHNTIIFLQSEHKLSYRT
jgi:hypothetical protein